MQITILADTNIYTFINIKYMYILVIKFDIPKQIYFFLSYYNDEKRDLKKYLSRSSSGLEKQKYFLNEKKES